MHKAFRTSVPGSNNLSLTIKSLLLAIVPTVIIIARSYGLDLAEAELVEVIESVFSILAVVGVAYGLLRKLFYKISA